MPRQFEGTISNVTTSTTPNTSEITWRSAPINLGDVWAQDFNEMMSKEASQMKMKRKTLCYFGITKDGKTIDLNKGSHLQVTLDEVERIEVKSIECEPFVRPRYYFTPTDDPITKQIVNERANFSVKNLSVNMNKVEGRRKMTEIALRLAEEGNNINGKRMLFGVEIEFVSFKKHSILKQMFKREGLSTLVTGDGVRQFSNHSWYIKSDSSITYVPSPSSPQEPEQETDEWGDPVQLPESWHGIEICSPPMHYGQKALKEIKTVLDIISKNGLVNESCGLHVHVSHPYFYSKKIVWFETFKERIEKLWKTLTPAVMMSLPQHRRDSQYATMASPYEENRYSQLNFVSLRTHGTVEFRAAEGTFDFGDLINWVSFCMSVVRHACNFNKRINEKAPLVMMNDINNGNEEAITTIADKACKLINASKSTRLYLRSRVSNQLTNIPLRSIEGNGGSWKKSLAIKKKPTQLSIFERELLIEEEK